MTYPLFATLKEFLITLPKTVSLEVADKLYQFHIIPMQKVREELGVWITASDNSGYRPKWWEFKKRRDGLSQHTYIDEWLNGSGAVDWTCEDFSFNQDLLLALIIKHTKYTRICIYNGFIHCDYKNTPNNARQLFEYRLDKADDKYKWFYLKNV